MAGLFEIAFQRNAWLAQRQTLISSNIANANVPGYRSADIEPFEKSMARVEGLMATHPRHIPIVEERRMARQAASGGDRTHSGNDVNVAGEFLKSGEVVRAFAVNTQVIKSFTRMMLTSVKI